jgi:hypothetical protein
MSGLARHVGEPHPCDHGRSTSRLSHEAGTRELFLDQKEGKGEEVRRLFVLVMIAMSVAIGSTSASALTTPRVFSLLDAPPGTDIQMGNFNFEQPPVGGDQFAFIHTLYKWAGTKKGARAGRLNVVVTFVTGYGSRFDHPALVLIDAQAYIAGGTVMASGYGHVNANGPAKLTLPIVGGTGIYANVRGYVKVRDLGNGNINKTNIEFHLLP